MKNKDYESWKKDLYKEYTQEELFEKADIEYKRMLSDKDNHLGYMTKEAHRQFYIALRNQAKKELDGSK